MATLVKTSDEPFELNVKRFYVPGYVLSSKCPKCKLAQERDLGENYLSYPKTGEPLALCFYCEPCEENWEEHVVVRVSVELAPKQNDNK